MIRDQVLQAIDVDVLVVSGRQQAEQQARAALPGHAKVETQLGDPRANLCVQGGDRRVGADVHPLRTDVPDRVTQALQVGVLHPRPLQCVDRHRAAEPARRAVGRDELLEQRHAARLIGDDQGVGQERGIRAWLRDASDERPIDLEAARDV